jgi:hypothetical protein
MAVTTFQLTGNPTNILPQVTTNGTITAFNQTTGAYTWEPTNNITGTFTNEVPYEILCDGLEVSSATVSFTVNSQTGIQTITNSSGGLPNLTPICGQTVNYKSNLVFTPALPIVSPITYLWSTSVGGSVISPTASSTNIIFTAGFTGNVTITLITTTPFETINTNILVTVKCAIANPDTVITPVNTPVTLNVSINDVVCN